MKIAMIDDGKITFHPADWDGDEEGLGFDVDIEANVQGIDEVSVKCREWYGIGEFSVKIAGVSEEVAVKLFYDFVLQAQIAYEQNNH